jgi:hypothetical protein
MARDEVELEEVDEVDVSRAMRGSKTIVTTLNRALNAAKKRRDAADVQIKQLEKVIKGFMGTDD